jgi:hypothetical protein
MKRNAVPFERKNFRADICGKNHGTLEHQNHEQYKTTQHHKTSLLL